MFKFPAEIIREVLEGKLEFKAIPINPDNEKKKKRALNNQARVNLRLKSEYTPVCTAYGVACRDMDGCPFELRLSNTKTVCTQYWRDFPDVPFDLRFHVPFIGTDQLDVEKSLKNLGFLREQGARYMCLRCEKPYEEKPTLPSGNSKVLEICGCWSLNFQNIDRFINEFKQRGNGESLSL